MTNNKQLLFLAEPNDAHRRFVISEVLADLDDETRNMLHGTGTHDRVIGYMCEMWLRAKPVSVSLGYGVVRYAEAREGRFPSVSDLDVLARGVRKGLKTARKPYGRIENRA